LKEWSRSPPAWAVPPSGQVEVGERRKRPGKPH
jgi:hypothetical protein